MKKLNLLIGAVLFSLIGIVSAQEYENCLGGGMMYGFSGGYGTSSMIFSWFIGILIIIALILLIFWLLNQINKNKK